MDEKLLVLINREWTGPTADRVFAAASSLDCWLPFLVAGGLWMLWRGGFRERAFLVCAALAVAVMDGLVSGNLKRAIDRPRPHQAMTGVRVVDLAKATPRFLALFREPRVRASRASTGDVEGRSFPSSHTMNLFAVATLSALFYRAGALAFLPALCVGYSRIYTGSHYPSDVAISALLATGLTLLLAAALEAAWKRLGPRHCAALHAAHPALFREVRA